MKIWVAVGCLLLFLIVSDAFDCRRKGINCVTGFCQPTGECDCPNGTEGKDCGLNTSSISTDCTVACLNNGTCIEVSNGTYGCYCNEDYIGDTCDRKRAEVECNGENMTITITPYTGFVGNVFITNSEDDTTCDFAKKEVNGVVSFEAVLSLTDGCGANVKNDTPADGDTTYTRDVKVRYSPYMATKYDQDLDVSCTHSSANTTDTKASIPDMDHTRETIDKEKVESTYKPIKLDVQERSGAKLTHGVKIGKKLRLYISLGDTTKYKKIKVESCVAFNGLTGENKREQPLVASGCPVSYEVITGPLVSEKSQTAVIVNFEAFKFINSATVEFECDVRHCKEGDTRCEPRSCFGKPNTAFGKRRKRDADATDEVLVRKSITVLDPTNTQILTGNLLHPADCMQRTEIITSVIIMATAIIVLFVICFFLALKVMRSRSGPKNVSNEMDSTMSSDETKLRIPRVRAVF